MMLDGQSVPTYTRQTTDAPDSPLTQKRNQIVQVTFEGETLSDILPKIRQFLEDVRCHYDPAAALIAMDEELPPAVKRAKKNGPGAAPTTAEIEAVRNAEAPPCSLDDVRASINAYVTRFGMDAAERHVPALIGARYTSLIPEAELWRAKAALDAAVAANKPAGA